MVNEEDDQEVSNTNESEDEKVQRVSENNLSIWVEDQRGRIKEILSKTS